MSVFRSLLRSVYLRIFALLLMSAISVCAFAQAEGQIAVGYSGREVTKSSDWGLDEAGQISAAIKITPDLLNGISNVRVCGVCAGLASKLNIENFKVWVRASLDGENLAEASATPKKGWNDIVFDTPCGIDADEFYVGYTLDLSDISYPISVVDGDDENGFFINTGTGWNEPGSEPGKVLSILAIIEADNLPSYDLAIVDAVVPSRMKIGSSSEVGISFANRGCMTVTGANVRFYENGEKGELYNIPMTLTPGATGTFSIEYSPLGTERCNAMPLKIEIESLNEGADENDTDNTWTGEFNLCKYDFIKRVFIEEFTTQKCSNCPSAAEKIHELLELPEYKDRITVCARHAGFHTDIFTSDLDEEMLVMYGEGGTYCPALMIDRTPFYSNGVPVISVPGDFSDLVSLVSRCLNNKASVDFSATAEYDSNSGKLRVKVFGGRDKVFGTTPARLSVYLVENNIFDKLQSGAYGNYYQQHVVRAADSTWGKVIEWDDDDDFSYECLLDPYLVADTDNTEIIAVVHDYDPDDISNCIVDNAFSTSEIEWNGFSSVNTISSDSHGEERIEYYDIQGRRLNSIEGVRGVVLKKVIRKDNSVEARKIIL